MAAKAAGNQMELSAACKADLQTGTRLKQKAHENWVQICVSTKNVTSGVSVTYADGSTMLGPFPNWPGFEEAAKKLGIWNETLENADGSRP